MRALLDVNVLVALLDPDHAHHGAVINWLDHHAAAGWATCPLTENGCVRILSLPNYPNPFRVSAALNSLRLTVAQANHEFWQADATILDSGLVVADRIHGPRQLTDIYLLALAVRHQGRLITLDQSIPLNAVHGAGRDHLVVI